MFVFLSIIIVATAFASFVAGLLALLSNPQKNQNRWFFALTTTITLWIPSNFIDSNVLHAVLTNLFLKLDFIGALFIGWILLEFASVYAVSAAEHPRISPRLRYRRWLLLTVNLITSVAIVSGIVVQSSIVQNQLSVSYSPLFDVYVMLLVLYLAMALGRLYLGRRRMSISERPGLTIIFLGLVLAVGSNIATNLIFPQIIESAETVKELNIFGYLGLLAFVFAVYAAITRQRLLDIRPIVGRALGYLLSLGVIGAAFIVVAPLITNLLLGNNVSHLTLQVIYAVLAIVLAVSFAPLKRFFDSLTSQIFFQDSYNSQNFIDQFNKVLVSTFDFDHLLHNSAQIITSNLKSSYCLFGIRETANTERRVVGTTGSPKFAEADIALVRSITPHMNRKVIVVDTLEPKYSKLQKCFQSYGAALVARLAASNNGDAIGFLVLGAKKSGNLYSSQEIKDVEIIANELVIAIQNALRTEEIEGFNATLQRRITDATRKLRHTNEKLRALDEAKDDFVSMASHQLRTPLTSIKGYTSMVLEGDAGTINETQRKLLEQSFVSSQRMVYLIADLLNVSRLKTGKFVIESAPVNLADVVQQELGQLKAAAAARSLTLTYSKPDNFPDLLLDETKTRQVIMNFVDNAVYYTPAGGNIEVKLVETPASVELRVIDTGIGVPKSEQPHLFTKFYRAGNARKARPDGTGLGLFMAKKVIIAEGGAIIFETTEGKGSTFGFMFSKSKLVAPSDAPMPEKAAV